MNQTINSLKKGSSTQNNHLKTCECEILNISKKKEKKTYLSLTRLLVLPYFFFIISYFFFVRNKTNKETKREHQKNV